MSTEELVFHSKKELRDFIENMDENMIINITVEKEDKEVGEDGKRADEGQ